MCEKPIEAVIIGASIADIPLVPVDRGVFDAPSTALSSIAMRVGGDAANEATVLARLGHRPMLSGVVGADATGDFVLRTLDAAGVDTACVARRAGLDTGINIVLVTPDGERTFITNTNGSLRALALSDVLPALETAAFATAKVACLASLFVSFALPLSDTVDLFDRLRAKGLILCADTTRPKHGETLKDIAPALSRLDYFFPNLSEAARLTGATDPDAIADALLSTGLRHAAIKLGGDGCLLKSATERHHVPACPARCVDTTGAGDTFAAAFIAALLEGKRFLECGRFANAAASLCVEHVGATDGGWTRADVLARLDAGR